MDNEEDGEGFAINIILIWGITQRRLTHGESILQKRTTQLLVSVSYSRWHSVSFVDGVSAGAVFCFFVKTIKETFIIRHFSHLLIFLWDDKRISVNFNHRLM
jgi:hypothetical protein